MFSVESSSGSSYKCECAGCDGAEVEFSVECGTDCEGYLTRKGDWYRVSALFDSTCAMCVGFFSTCFSSKDYCMPLISQNGVVREFCDGMLSCSGCSGEGSVNGNADISSEEESMKLDDYLNTLGSEPTEISIANTVHGNLSSLTAVGDSVERLSVGRHVYGKLEAIKAMTKLTSLLLDSHEVSGSLEDLSGLTQLTMLTIIGQLVVGDLKHLSSLTNLIYLEVNCRGCSGSLAALQELTELQHVRLVVPAHGSIDSLVGLAKLTSLIVFAENVEGNLQTTQELPNLHTLSLPATKVEGALGDLGSSLNTLILDDCVGVAGGLASLDESYLVISLKNTSVKGELRDVQGQTSLMGLRLGNY